MSIVETSNRPTQESTSLGFVEVGDGKIAVNNKIPATQGTTGGLTAYPFRFTKDFTLTSANAVGDTLFTIDLDTTLDPVVAEVAQNFIFFHLNELAVDVAVTSAIATTSGSVQIATFKDPTQNVATGQAGLENAVSALKSNLINSRTNCSFKLDNSDFIQIELDGGNNRFVKNTGGNKVFGTYGKFTAVARTIPPLSAEKLTATVTFLGNMSFSGRATYSTNSSSTAEYQLSIQEMRLAESYRNDGSHFIVIQCAAPKEIQLTSGMLQFVTHERIAFRLAEGDYEETIVVTPQPFHYFADFNYVYFEIPRSMTVTTNLSSLGSIEVFTNFTDFIALFMFDVISSGASVNRHHSVQSLPVYRNGVSNMGHLSFKRKAEIVKKFEQLTLHILGVNVE